MDFLTTLTKTFTGITGKNTVGEFKKQKLTMEKFITDNDEKFNSIIKELINGYLNNNKYIAFQLLNSVICKDTAVYLSDTLQKQLSTINFEGTEILYEQKKYKCNDYNSCLQLIKDIKFKTKKGQIINKKEICDSIATFHIRIMNLIAALLVNLDPLTNIAIQKMQLLYQSINDNTIEISICNNKELKSKIDNYKLDELINLYLYNLLLSNDTEQVSLIEEYNNLLNILNENLNAKLSNVMVDDIKVITNMIKDNLVDFHNKFRVNKPSMNNNIVNNSNSSSNSNSASNIETNNSSPNNNIIKEKIKVDEQSNALLEQQTEIDAQTDAIQVQSEQLNNHKTVLTEQSSIIDEQKDEMENLKAEMTKLNEQLEENSIKKKEEIKKLEAELAEVNMKYEKLQKQKQAENNNEVLKLKGEIMSLMKKVKKESGSIKQNQVGGEEVEKTAERFRDFMKRFNVKNSTKLLQNKFFKLFESNLVIPTEQVNNICSGNIAGNPIRITFQDDSSAINAYLQIYNDMSSYYMNRINDMIRIIEDELLEIKYNDKKEVTSLNIRKITETELKEKEVRVRKLLAEYVNQIHTYYLSAIGELNVYLSSYK